MSETKTVELLDAMGRRNNRKLADRPCNECGKPYQPKTRTSKFCSRTCMWARSDRRPPPNRIEGPIWWVNPRGYVEGRVWVDGKRVRVKQHRWIMAQYLGRELEPGEDVHHINNIKTDNRVENLQVLKHGEHTTLTSKTRVYPRGYKMKLSPEQLKKRSEDSKRLHREGRAMAPQFRKAYGGSK